MGLTSSLFVWFYYIGFFIVCQCQTLHNAQFLSLYIFFDKQIDSLSDLCYHKTKFSESCALCAPAIRCKHIYKIVLEIRDDIHIVKEVRCQYMGRRLADVCHALLGDPLLAVAQIMQKCR